MKNKYYLSSSSKKNMESLHPDLIEVINKVLSLGIFDFAVTNTHRGEEYQNKYYAEGKSKLKWPESKHNKMPAEAFHFTLIINGKYNDQDTGAYYIATGVFLAIALTLGIRLRTGADWDGDMDTQDQKLNDLMHLELLNSKEK